ncbi:MAG: AarF/ABC1/UbiB kinase family protein [Verrucomicrobia bacterium]|nr:MAG: AarF/ABC1/UbiB kinase family protein [Verrucomicrobiota bacterium]
MKPFDLIANAVRTKEIATVLVRNGFADLLHRINPPRWLLNILDTKPRPRRSIWERVRLVAEDLGPTSVKLGQMMSMRPDLLPAGLIHELRRLQDDVRAESFELMGPVLKEELEAKLDEVFSEFEQTPVACASIGQVYRARLKSSGAEVAVKVQRPGIQRKIDSDFNILLWFAQKVHENAEDLKPYDFPGILLELKRAMDRELDYRNEARNALFFNLQNPDTEHVFAPKVYEDVSGERVLVTEWIAGMHIDQVPVPSELGLTVAARGAQSLFNQVLIQGFFHADPHAGNLSITRDGRLCFMDWGQAGQLTRQMRFDLIDLFGAFLQGDAEQIARISADLPRSGTGFDRSTIEKEIMLAIRENFNPATGEGQIGRGIIRIFHIFSQNGIDVGRDYSLMAKAILSIEEAGKTLDPDFSFPRVFSPVLSDVHRERRNPAAIFKGFRRSLVVGLHRMQDIPAELHRILKRLEKGEVTVNFHHRGLEDLDDAISAASNKVTLGVIIGALLMGSSMIITTGIKPTLFGYPALGMVGYVMSAVLGIWLIFDILRSGKRH